MSIEVLETLLHHDDVPELGFVHTLGHLIHRVDNVWTTGDRKVNERSNDGGEVVL